MTRPHPRSRSPWAALRADLARYVPPRSSLATTVRIALGTEGLWALAGHRLGSWIYGDCPRPLAPLLKLVWKPCDLVIRRLVDIHLSIGAEIGPGLYIGHHGGIWVNPAARLGANCNLGQGVVIGVAGAGRAGRAPVLGDQVWVGPHAVITGPVQVGREAVIGANSLVVADVPERALVVGVPARMLARSGSAHLIRAPGVAQAG